MAFFVPLRPRRAFLEKGGAWTVAGIGAVTLFGIVVVALLDSEPLSLWLLELLVGMAGPIVLVYAGFRFGVADLPAIARWRIATGTMAGIFLASAFGGWMIYHQGLQGGDIIDGGYFALTLGAIGAIVGLVAGVAQLDPSHRRALFPDGHDGPRWATPFPSDATPASSPLTDVQRRHVDLVLYEHQRTRLSILEYAYLRRDKTVTVDQVHNHVAVDLDVESVARRAALRRSLEETHLPALAEAGLVEYDREEGTVRAVAEGFGG